MRTKIIFTTANIQKLPSISNLISLRELSVLNKSPQTELFNAKFINIIDNRQIITLVYLFVFVDGESTPYGMNYTQSWHYIIYLFY